jgi:hypothetical protein
VTFEEATREAARVANNTVQRCIRKHRDGRAKHEDDLTGWIAGALDTALDGEIGGLTWDTSVLTHRRSGEEGRYGADLLVHVRMETPTRRYSKGVLVQAKLVEPDENMSRRDHTDLMEQCQKMLDHTAASFVFNYSKRGMRCGSASVITGSSRRDLYGICQWTSCRFFLELFRCPIGDPNITSASVDDLAIRRELQITASGNLTEFPHAAAPTRARRR